ncbi:LamG domain-containing protein [Paenibacillus sp. PAMC21692]|uniref:LamG domain-containing protein n=1 Tax=Paenibacillus sp. PAMC21692 TaxID=2762320 RepID=UPI00164DA862|nr:LamG domain-containing protein [Paenibacillus sp. PAMC21692]QNK55826.1 LamG domain-containing protein [Paenibacillus sp. PAMC21692]
MNDVYRIIVNHSQLISFWDFAEQPGQEAVAKGPFPYRLTEMAGPIERVEDGPFGAAAQVKLGQWWNLPRHACPELNFHGKDAKLTVLAWLKRENIPNRGCEAIAGIWNETEKKRQYCMFVNLNIWDSADQVCGHVSAVGGPTPGYKYCMTSAIGSTPIVKEEWHCVAFTYDGQYAKVYLDGVLDEREDFNPYLYDSGLFDGGDDGANFTVAAVHRSNEMGNFYTGAIGGLAVFKEALGEDELAELCKITV